MFKSKKDFLKITGAILISAIGIYFFKFANNFSFGGITGLAVIVAKTGLISASDFSFVANILLLILPLFFWAFLTVAMKKTEEKRATVQRKTDMIQCDVEMRIFIDITPSHTRGYQRRSRWSACPAEKDAQHPPWGFSSSRGSSGTGRGCGPAPGR